MAAVYVFISVHVCVCVSSFGGGQVGCWCWGSFRERSKRLQNCSYLCCRCLCLTGFTKVDLRILNLQTPSVTKENNWNVEIYAHRHVYQPIHKQTHSHCLSNKGWQLQGGVTRMSVQPVWQLHSQAIHVRTHICRNTHTENVYAHHNFWHRL